MDSADLRYNGKNLGTVWNQVGATCPLLPSSFLPSTPSSPRWCGKAPRRSAMATRYLKTQPNANHQNKTPNCPNPPKSQTLLLAQLKTLFADYFFFPGVRYRFPSRLKEPSGGQDANAELKESPPRQAYTQGQESSEHIKRQTEVISISMVSTRHNVSADWLRRDFFFFFICLFPSKNQKNLNALNPGSVGHLVALWS